MAVVARNLAAGFYAIKFLMMQANKYFINIVYTKPNYGPEAGYKHSLPQIRDIFPDGKLVL